MEHDKIDTFEFWKDRLKDAKEKDALFRSVYITTPRSWDQIAIVHRNVCSRLIKDTDKVLDAGCGYGRASEWFKNYTGTDFSPDFIAEAKQLYPNKTFIQADMRKLPFKDKSFDWGVCVSIKHMVIGRKGKEYWQEMENELKRVCDKVLILEYVDPAQYEIV